jgi:hypothetical protein
LPIVVRGIDLLGQPFEERTATFDFNLHGCRYASRYHLPKNAWVTLEVPSGSEFENARARVAWIQRPPSVREFFQISVELETPQNIWRLEQAPQDWAALQAVSRPVEGAEQPHFDAQLSEVSESRSLHNLGASGEQVMDEMNGVSASSESNPEGCMAARSAQGTPSPSQLSAELDQREADHENQAVVRSEEPSAELGGHKAWMAEEVFAKWKREFALAQEAAHERLTGRQTELLGEMRSEFEHNLSEAKRLIGEIEKNRDALHAENQAAIESANRLAQERAGMGATRDSHPSTASPKREQVAEEAATRWRERLAAEMDAAGGQWNELLQSSLDSGVHRIAEQLSERASQLRQPLLETLNDAQETAARLKGALDEELSRAKSSLAEIERSAAQLSSLSAQIGSATAVALEDLHRRLELILNAQTEEMGERAEKLTGSTLAKAAADLDAVGRKKIGEAVDEIESKLAAHYQRLPDLLGQLSAREVQAEESLRLHRERLRQISEAGQHEFLSQFDAAAAAARTEFETARQAASAEWTAETERSAALASQAATDAVEQVARGFEEQWRARLQALADRTAESSRQVFEQKADDTKSKLAADLDAHASGHIAQFRERLEEFANDLAGRSRTQIEQAAEATAASFGQVLRGVSDQEIDAFSAKAAGIVETRQHGLEASATQLLREFETSAESSLGRLHQQMAAQLETGVAEGRTALFGEINSSLAAFRSEREAREKEWIETLERLNAESAARYHDRIDTASDSWVLSSVRRLNEHGQNLVESLTRSADQALRESCAKLFDGLAEILRERSAAAIHAGHSAAAVREAAEAAVPPPLENEPGPDRASL